MSPGGTERKEGQKMKFDFMFDEHGNTAENWETWNTRLTIFNDEGLYHMAMEAGREMSDDPDGLADRLMHFFKCACEEAERPDGLSRTEKEMWSYLDSMLCASLNRVNWHMIALYIIDSLEDA
jgi:hypothetical protein